MSLTIVTSLADLLIPPLLLTVPTTEQEVLTAARALERFIITNRAHEGLEEALGKVLPPFDQGWAEINCDVTGCPALERYYAHQDAEGGFAEYQKWLRATVKTRVREPQSATSNPMTSPASSAPLYTMECEPPTPPSEVPTISTMPAQTPSGPPDPQSDPPAKSKKRKAEADAAPKAKKNKVTTDPDRVYTCDDPGDYFVPPKAEVCDWCKNHGRIEECLFPTDQSTTCVVCKQRRQSCVADNRRHALGKPAYADDPVRTKRPTVWKQTRKSGVKSDAKAERSGGSKSGAGLSKSGAGPSKSGAGPSKSGAGTWKGSAETLKSGAGTSKSGAGTLKSGAGTSKGDAGASTSTAVRKDQASKSTARRQPFVVIPCHSLNLSAYKALSDMGPTQQVCTEDLSADILVQQMARTHDILNQDVAELQSRVATLSAFADRFALPAIVAEILPLIPPETLTAAEDDLRANFDNVKVLPSDQVEHHSYKSVIEQCLNLIQGQLDRGTAIQSAIADLSGPLASAESTFVTAFEKLRSR